jgi:hypothetical protein
MSCSLFALASSTAAFRSPLALFHLRENPWQALKRVRRGAASGKVRRLPSWSLFFFSF